MWLLVSYSVLCVPIYNVYNLILPTLVIALLYILLLDFHLFIFSFIFHIFCYIKCYRLKNVQKKFQNPKKSYSVLCVPIYNVYNLMLPTLVIALLYSLLLDFHLFIFSFIFHIFVI